MRFDDSIDQREIKLNTIIIIIIFISWENFYPESGKIIAQEKMKKLINELQAKIKFDYKFSRLK